MNRVVSLSLLAAGIVLTIFGVNELNSSTSDLSRMLTGAPTDRSIWMMVGGAVLVVLGLKGLAPGPRKN
jgi:hypothetical protein